MSQTSKKLLLTFIISFTLNFIWEHAHSYLYAGFMGGAIAESVLLQATFVDAFIITILALPFIYSRRWQQKSWVIIPAGVLVSILIELYALHTGAWAYNRYMPIVPLLSVGLTPTIQLGLLGYLSYWIAVKM